MSTIAAYLIAFGVIILFFLVFFRLIRIVPEQEAWIIEELGKFRKSLGPGLHLVIPGLQKVSYKQLLKEEALDVPPQVCITRDNVQVSVDGVLYFKVLDPVKASYGIENYRYATAQLAQTTMRSEIGKIDLDNSFSEREIQQRDCPQCRRSLGSLGNQGDAIRDQGYLAAGNGQTIDGTTGTCRTGEKG